MCLEICEECIRIDKIMWKKILQIIKTSQNKKANAWDGSITPNFITCTSTIFLTFIIKKINIFIFHTINSLKYCEQLSWQTKFVLLTHIVLSQVSLKIKLITQLSYGHYNLVVPYCYILNVICTASNIKYRITLCSFFFDLVLLLLKTFN